MNVEKPFLGWSLHLPPCSWHPLLLDLCSIDLKDGYDGVYLLSNYQCKTPAAPCCLLEDAARWSLSVEGARDMNK